MLDFDLDLLKEYQREVETILDNNWDKIEAIASALLEAGSLTGEQVEDSLRDDSSPSHDGKGNGIPEASPTFAGRPPKIISGRKRSLWGGRERTAVRAWDSNGG